MHWTPQNNPRSPILVGMFHDLCKINRFIVNTTKGGKKSFKIKSETAAGHGDLSVALLSKRITLTEEECLCIEHHMGAYCKQWGAFDRAIRQYPNVIWTHTADMYASKVMDV